VPLSDISYVDLDFVLPYFQGTIKEPRACWELLSWLLSHDYLRGLAYSLYTSACACVCVRVCVCVCACVLVLCDARGCRRTNFWLDTRPVTVTIVVMTIDSICGDLSILLTCLFWHSNTTGDCVVLVSSYYEDSIHLHYIFQECRRLFTAVAKAQLDSVKVLRAYICICLDDDGLLLEDQLQFTSSLLLRI
jgi:hypothetical protein